MSTEDFFSTDIEGLPAAADPVVVRLRDGDTHQMRLHSVRKQIGPDELRMLTYNGSIPGPTLHVDEGSEITVEVVNDTDMETTVHWHGLRLENRHDGVPHETQEPIPIGGTYTHKLRFPDAGLYWYHPHMREDYAQEMGLYGPIVVEPSDPDYWPPADRFLTLTLDDLLVEDGQIAAFHKSGPTFVAMGRFGNVLLVNGNTEFAADVTAGEVVRLYLVNTANTRIFNVAIADARMKLVGGDSGRVEREEFVEELLLAPSERAVVDVHFDRPGVATLQHRTPDTTYELGGFAVSGGPTGQSSRSFDELREASELTAERGRIQADLDRPPDKILAFYAEMPLLYGDDAADAAAGYVCPMHPEVTSDEPGTCPKCGMKLIPAAPASYVCPMHPEVTSDEPGTCPKCGMKLIPADPDGPPKGEPAHEHEHGHDHGDGLEWEDLMPEINRESTPSNMLWKLIDRETGAENAAIAWDFTVGDRVKIRLVNEMESDHPMHHPFHFHGAGRFLILTRDEVVEPNLVWKDTVLVRAGETVDVLLDVSNPGLWMAHCHIAEHTESGMMFSFNVARAPTS